MKLFFVFLKRNLNRLSFDFEQVKDIENKLKEQERESESHSISLPHKVIAEISLTVQKCVFFINK